MPDTRTPLASSVAPARMSELSGYRLMWIMTLFDLPVGTKKERKAATAFRNFLLDQGFEMAQFSVYMRFCSGKEQAETYYKRIRKPCPREARSIS